MSVELPKSLPTYWCASHFSEPAQQLRMHPREFCERVNQNIAPLKNLRDRLIARVVVAALACMFCAAAGVYYTQYLDFSLSKRKSRIYSIHYFNYSSLVGKIALGFLGCLNAILAVRALATYLRYSEQYQMVEQDMKQYRSPFLFKTTPESPISQEILRFLPDGFKSYPIGVETREWKMEGGKEVDGIFTELKMTEIKDWTEVNDDSKSWLELLTFVVQKPEVPESNKKELVKEVFPLVDSGHVLRLHFSLLNQDLLREGEVIFRRSHLKENQPQEIVVYEQGSEIHFSKADDLKGFLIKHYQIGPSDSQGQLSGGKDEEDLKDSFIECDPVGLSNNPVPLSDDEESNFL